MSTKSSTATPTVIRWRLYVVIVVLGTVFTALAGRAAYIQVVAPDELIEQGDNRTLRVRDVAAYRGTITDRHGVNLAVSVPAKAVYVDPKIIVESGSFDDQRRWQALAQVLAIDLDNYAAKLKDPSRRFVYLKRQVTPAMADFVKKLGIPGVYLRPESKRYYPAGEISAHVIGVTDVDDRGLEGIERLYNQYLTGEEGVRRIRRDGKDRQVEIIQERKGKMANDLKLTIDQRVQSLVYRELKAAHIKYRASSVSAVVVDATTGEILALANSPSFNPNNRSNVSAHQLRNRAITDAFEPGSVLKPLAVAAAIEYGSFTADAEINTSPGRRRLGGSVVRDPRDLGVMTPREILKKSSNVGTSIMSSSIPKEVFIDTYYNAGLMTDSGANLLGESRGIFHDRKRWSDFELATLSFGYGISVTSLQLARLYSTIANEGIKPGLKVVQGFDSLEASERVFSEQTATSVLHMLEAVTEPGGSGTKAAVPGYRVAGKTGTSRKAVSGGYGEEYVNVFAGIAPVSKPKFVVVVVINEPGGDFYYAGDTAAPVFSSIMSDVLSVTNTLPDAGTTTSAKQIAAGSAMSDAPAEVN